MTPFLEVINSKTILLGLGTPQAEVGPTFMASNRFEDCGGDRIRKGAVWFVSGRNCGFHVDFCASGQIHIEAWTGKERSTSTWIKGSVTEGTLKKDLTVCLVAAGLTDLARTEEVRADLFKKKARN